MTVTDTGSSTKIAQVAETLDDSKIEPLVEKLEALKALGIEEKANLFGGGIIVPPKEKPDNELGIKVEFNTRVFHFLRQLNAKTDFLKAQEKEQVVTKFGEIFDKQIDAMVRNLRQASATAQQLEEGQTLELVDGSDATPKGSYPYRQKALDALTIVPETLLDAQYILLRAATKGVDGSADGAALAGDTYTALHKFEIIDVTDKWPHKTAPAIKNKIPIAGEKFPKPPYAPAGRVRGDSDDQPKYVEPVNQYAHIPVHEVCKTDETLEYYEHRKRTPIPPFGGDGIVR